jgi:hypothetical protein
MHPELENRFSQRNAELFHQVGQLEAAKQTEREYDARYENAMDRVRMDEWKKSDAFMEDYEREWNYHNHPYYYWAS